MFAVCQEGCVTFRTTRRYMRFRTMAKAYTYAVQYKDREDWMREYMPDRLDEQKNDGIYAAFGDFRDWYESRKSRAKNHIRMVGKLLLWHKHSIEKLWDPSRPENYDRIMSVYYDN
jgi:hypothetical protein